MTDFEPVDFDDITFRLRHDQPRNPGRLRMEAADEIEQLRRVLDAWRETALSLDAALAEQEAGLERIRAEADDIARWIVEQFDYPVEMATDRPPSEPWRRRIEDAWVERDGDPNNPEYSEDIRAFVRMEGGWVG